MWKRLNREKAIVTITHPHNYMILVAIHVHRKPSLLLITATDDFAVMKAATTVIDA